LITARDMAIATVPAMPAPPIPAQAVPLRERILLVVLYVAVLASSLAFIEPSPHDAMMGLLAVACLVAGVRFDRFLALPLLLLLVWNVAGMMALIDVVDQEKTIQYTATSLYLAVAALLFACLFAQNTLPRLATLRAAYVATALFTALFGLAVYAHLLPGEDTFMWAGRVRSTFKDPNVFGPFLILPALFVIERMIAHGVKLRHLAATLVLVAGLFFSFSRGAWINFALSAAVLLALLVLTAPDRRARMRPIVLGAASVAVLALALVAVSTIESVRDMLMQRAQLVQSYDVGDGGRFVLQELAINTLFDHPLGLGPFEFSRIYGLQQHNVYLQAFLVYGWVGGITYVAMVLVTLFVGLRTALLRTPWQSYLIAAYAAFVGIAFESFVIDSDHWRHFFLIFGMIWGLSAATVKFKRDERHLACVRPAWVTG
jgi:O-antigen ligase